MLDCRHVRPKPVTSWKQWQSSYFISWPQWRVNVWLFRTVTRVFHDERHQGDTPNLFLSYHEKLTFFQPLPCALAGLVCGGDCGSEGGPPPVSEHWAPGCVLPPLSPADSSLSQPCSLFQGHRLEQIPSWKAPQTPARPPGCPEPGALLQPKQ